MCIRDRVAEVPGFAGGLEYQASGIGTEFGAFQPNYEALTFIESDCFGSGSFVRSEIRGLRPDGSFNGPFIGGSGSASFDLTGGPANGFASLWLARSGALETSDVVVNFGGAHPIALRADLLDFGRRFPMVPLDSTGAVTMPFFQDVSFEGALLGQWLVFDATGTLVSTSDFAINRSPF